MTVGVFNDINSALEIYVKEGIAKYLKVKFGTTENATEIWPCFRGQWWYYDKYNKVYFYYILEEKSALLVDPGLLYTYINTTIIEGGIQSSGFRINCDIIGPGVNWFLNPTKDDSKLVGQTEHITADTIIGWPIFKGESFGFIYDKAITRHWFTPDCKKEDFLEAYSYDYIKKLALVRNKYERMAEEDPDLYKESWDDYFDEYRDLFEEKHGIRLLSIEEYAHSYNYGDIHIIEFNIIPEDEQKFEPVTDFDIDTDIDIDDN